MTAPMRPLRHALAAALILIGAAGASGAESLRDLNVSVRDLSFPTRDLDGGVRDLSNAIVDTVAVNETATEIRVELPADILFDFDKATIRDAARPALATAAKVLQAHAGARVQIEGHADSKGSDTHNQPLSLRRAEAVRTWLGDREGVPLATGKTVGYGARRPAVPNTRPDGSDDPDGRQRNRRVEIVIAK